MDPSENSDRALVVASVGGDLELVKKCIEQFGADVCAQQNKSLVLAAYNGHVEIVKYLLNKGADQTALTCTSLSASCARHNLPMVKFLIEELGIDATCNQNSALRTAYYEKTKSVDLVQYLISQGADVNTNNGELIINAAQGRLDMLRLFKKAGGDLRAANDEPLRKAAEHGHEEIVAYLVGRCRIPMDIFSKEELDGLSEKIRNYLNRKRNQNELKVKERE
jgi:ankyrin repeat protein